MSDPLLWPTLNAFLNATSAVCLAAGFRCIRRKQIVAHAACMITAGMSSTLFLISYLAYHAHVGSVKFLGAGWSRPVYVVILITHTILAIVIVPMALRTFSLAVRQRFTQHRALARWTLPLWLYVCITGLLVYWMLYHAPIAEACPGCKEALFDPAQLPQTLSTAKGYALSIGLLLAIPGMLVTVVSLLIARAARRARLTPPGIRATLQRDVDD